MNHKKLLFIFFTLNIFIHESNQEPFLIFSTLYVASKAIIASVVLIKKIIIIKQIFQIYSWKKKIDNYTRYYKTGKQFLKDKEYKNMDKTLEAYKNFQRTNEEICRVFFINKVSDIFFNEENEREDHQILEDLKKENIKTFNKKKDKSDYRYVAFYFSEIINILKTNDRNAKIFTMGYKAIQKNMPSILEAGVKYFLKHSMLQILDLTDIQFIRNINKLTSMYKNSVNILTDVNTVFQKNFRKDKNIDEEEELTDIGDEREGNNDFKKDNKKDEHVNFLCEMIYVLSLKTIGSELCVQIHIFDFEEWEKFVDYDDMDGKIQKKGRSANEICLNGLERENLEVKQNSIENRQIPTWVYFKNLFTSKDAIYNDQNFLKTKNELFYKSFIGLYQYGEDFIVENKKKKFNDPTKKHHPVPGPKYNLEKPKIIGKITI